ncbi:D-amino-acid dehydrogenase [Noviherbaspirillum humi]|uniref:D-amino-acid dehydrogenase n=1 Tax=Noviherbaspirillum humi TaxID=1688639 RepID=A0A239G4D9_9BURK|nr:D-amino acid dehydrogenase [Noviherbaspirillum humi]SNS62904.1 D-amino-acid dehydrogenase [Noviherbaspirillum humi]
MAAKQIAVIGGGVVGVCTAYFLAEAGHQVVVLERQQSVAQEASLANSGVTAPGYGVPMAAPGMPRKILSHLFKSEAAVVVKPTLERALWRWARRWLNECEVDRYRVNRERMQRVAIYSHAVLQHLREHYRIDYERTQGVLQLFRAPDDIAAAETAAGLLADGGIPYRMVSAEEAREIEPALAPSTTLAGGLYLPDDESGNCPLFTKRMKQIAEDIGVRFLFATQVDRIAPGGHGVTLHIGAREFPADAVVLAAGADSVKLLEPLGVQVPLYPVKGYSATATIKNFDEAPVAAVSDEHYKVSISRMGMRIRIAGTAEVGSRSLDMHEAALRMLAKVGDDWFPGAANYHAASFWSGAHPMLPDGPPILGATPLRNVYANIGHGSLGWAMAAGSGKIVADIVSGHNPDIDMHGLTLSRYGSH